MSLGDRRAFVQALAGTMAYSGSSSWPNARSSERHELTRSQTTFDVKAYGARGDGSADDTASIRAAIAAADAAGGGVVWFPRGTYQVTSTLEVPAATNKGVQFAGEGCRDTHVTAAAAGMGTLVRCGSSVGDPSGTYAHVSQYGGIKDLTFNAVSAARDVTLVLLQTTHFFEVANVNLEGASADGSGLKLVGSQTAGGLNAAAPPHAWRNKFYNVWVDDCTHPLYIENGDENDFFSCNFSLPRGVSAPPDSLCAIEVRQGRNNRFYGALVMGDVDLSHRGAYVGVKCCAPKHGEVRDTLFFGLVAEGFDRGIWIEDANVLGTMAIGYHSSINAVAYVNVGGTRPPGNGTLVWSPIGNIFYYAGRELNTDPIELTYGSTVQITAPNGNYFTLRVPDNKPFVIAAPNRPVGTQRLTLEILNNSGSEMGSVRWDPSFLLAGPLPGPTNGKRRTITFQYNGANWVEQCRVANDIG